MRSPAILLGVPAVSRLDRRRFLATTAAAGSLLVLPSRARAVAPSDRLRTAHVGVGGMGRGDLGSVASHASVEVAALCDVDQTQLAPAAKQFPKAKTYSDYRSMIDELGNEIDAVVVSTPDHTHAPAAMTALLAGKHVYCQKPLTHEVFEARKLRETAEASGLVTQMGIQVHASVQYRSATELIQRGTIGKVREVHAWSSKNWGYDGPAFQQTDPVPASLDWNLWLGTAAERPYVSGVYHQRDWRKLIDFGTGTLGDMGVHIFDTPYRACGLTAPNWARTTCRPPTGVGHPEQNVVEYEFPGTRYTADTLRWVWYDGGLAPPDLAQLPVEFEEGFKLPGQGSLFIGEKGVCLLPHVGPPQLVNSNDSAVEMPKLEPLNHYHQWVDACLGKTETSAHFGYAGPLTEALLLGVVANRFPGTKLEWNAEKLAVTNVEAANALLKRPYRDGFTVDGL
jgi:predicted dehydrogenase